MSTTARRARLLLPALVAAVVQVAGTFGAANRQPGARGLDVIALVLLLTGPALLLARRRWPVGTLVATAAVVLAFLALGYPYGPVVVSFVVAVLNAPVRGRRRDTWIVAGLCYAGLVAVVWLRNGTPGWFALSGVAAWLLALLAIGELIRARAERVTRERTARAEAARRQATEERLRIARDLHDVLAHHVSLINVQAGTALHLLEDQPELARDALAAIKSSSKEVLVELRAMLGVLRRVDEAAPRAPTGGLAGLDQLAERVRAGGLPVTVRRRGPARELPVAVDTAAFRIVQEALTNAHRHAGEATATVLVDYSATDLLVVQVDDDGRGPSAPSGDPLGGGNGIPGMRERAAALGGQLWTGARPGRGFRVHATLPSVPQGSAHADTDPDTERDLPTTPTGGAQA